MKKFQAGEISCLTFMVKSVFPAVNFLIIKTISTEVAFFYWGLGGQGGKEKVINHYNKQRNSTSSFSSLRKKINKNTLSTSMPVIAEFLNFMHSTEIRNKNFKMEKWIWMERKYFIRRSTLLNLALKYFWNTKQKKSYQIQQNPDYSNPQLLKPQSNYNLHVHQTH